MLHEHDIRENQPVVYSRKECEKLISQQEKLREGLSIIVPVLSELSYSQSRNNDGVIGQSLDGLAGTSIMADYICDKVKEQIELAHGQANDLVAAYENAKNQLETYQNEISRIEKEFGSKIEPSA